MVAEGFYPEKVGSGKNLAALVLLVFYFLIWFSLF